MSRILDLALFGILTVLFLLPVSAQTAPDIPAGPVPPQILSARKVFIANAGAESNFYNANGYVGGPNRAYNEFYAAMKDWAHYELVAAPGDADLVFEISQRDRVVGSLPEPRLTVRIIDPKNDIAVWELSTYVEVAGRVKNREKNYEIAMAKLVNDVKALVSPTPAPAAKQ